MAVAIMVEVPGITAAQYDAAIKEVFPGGKAPQGLISHVAGPADGFWRAVDVWESQQAFDTFAQNALGPALHNAGVQGVPVIKSWAVHNSIHTH